MEANSRDLLRFHSARKKTLTDQRDDLLRAVSASPELTVLRRRLADLTDQITAAELTIADLVSDRSSVETKIADVETRLHSALPDIEHELHVCVTTIEYITRVMRATPGEDTSDLHGEEVETNGTPKVERPYPTLELLTTALHRMGGGPMVHQLFGRLLEVHPHWKTPDELVAIDRSLIVAEITAKLASQYEKSSRVTNTEGKHYEEASYRRILKFLMDAQIVKMTKESHTVLYQLDLLNEQARDLIDTLYKLTLGDLMVARIIDSHKELFETRTTVDDEQMIQRCTSMYLKASSLTEVLPKEIERRRKEKRDRRAPSSRPSKAQLLATIIAE